MAVDCCGMASAFDEPSRRRAPPTWDPPPINGDLQAALSSHEWAFTVSDPSRPDNPIVYASERFYQTTEFGPSDVIGVAHGRGKSW